MAKRAVMTMIIVVVALLCALTGRAHDGVVLSSKKLYLKNKCGFSVWPAIVGSTSPNTDGQIELKSGESISVEVSPQSTWTVWGRTGCVFDSQGVGQCDSADCGKRQCEKKSVTPATQATFEFMASASASAKPDLFGTDLTNGYNLPFVVAPFSFASPNATGHHCYPMGCTGETAAVCPKDLQILKGGVVVGCYGHCDGSNCNPPDYAKAFAQACPRTSPFSPRSICPYFTVGYMLIFCPK
eukprot:Gb_12185 [translate_table: standard]